MSSLVSKNKKKQGRFPLPPFVKWGLLICAALYVASFFTGEITPKIVPYSDIKKAIREGSVKKAWVSNELIGITFVDTNKKEE